jgi:AbrB family looped-hinge helix DNA binding protein
MITALREKSQITLPKEVVDELEIKKGDNLEIVVQDGKIIITPVLVIDKSQAWFWTKEWQDGEREADEDIRMGRVSKAMNLDELMEHLDKLKEETNV